MADFNGTILTDKGRNLLSKALTGTALQFTKVALGDGVWDSSVNPEELNDLVSKKIDLPINNLSVTGDGTAVLRFVLTNTGLTEGFFTREIGIYANDPDLGEILYAVTYSDNPDFIPSDGVVKIENITDVYTVISNVQNVTAVISDTVVIATKDDVKNLSGVDDSLILTKLKNVDGAGSGLDADTIDGKQANDLANVDLSNITSLGNILNLDGNGSGLDADLLDGLQSGDFLSAKNPVYAYYNTGLVNKSVSAPGADVWFDLPDVKITIPEDGLYLVCANIRFWQSITSDSKWAKARITINGNNDDDLVVFKINPASNNYNLDITNTLISIKRFSKDDVLQVQGYISSNQSGDVSYSNQNGNSSILAYKIGN